MNPKTSSIIQVVQLIVLIFILIYVGNIYHLLSDKEGEEKPRIENSNKQENHFKMPDNKTELEKLQNLSTTKGRPGRVTVSEYARITGDNVDTVRARITRGELDAKMVRHRYLINLARNLPESGND